MTTEQQTSNAPVGFHRLTVFLVVVTIVLLVAGALVTSNEAGDSVPDWPMSFGRWILGSRHFQGNVRYEYSHRVIASLVSISTVVITLWAWFGNGICRKIAWLSLAASGLVLAQAAIGGVRVLFPGQKPLIAVPHALVAQSFFCLAVALCLVSSRGWNAGPARKIEEAGLSLRLLTRMTLGAVLIQLVLGAGFRHGAFGIAPHVLGAIAVLGFVTIMTTATLQRAGNGAYLRRPAIIAQTLLFVQIGLGISAYLARVASLNDPQPLEPMISLTVAHVLVGALTLGSVLVLALRVHQTLAPYSVGASENSGGAYSDNPAGMAI